MSEQCMWTIEWSDKQISNNAWYQAPHWAVRSKNKNDWRAFFTPLIKQAGVPLLPQYRLLLEFNSRLDPSNTIAMVKLFEDTLKNVGLIHDDSKKYCKGIIVEPNDDLPSKTYRITLFKV